MTGEEKKMVVFIYVYVVGFMIPAIIILLSLWKKQ